MSIAKVTEIIASSTKSFEDAIEQGVARACETLNNVRNAWVKDQECVISNNRIESYRVTLKITFVLK